MAENKTKATVQSVDTFLGGVADPAQRDDARALRIMMERVSGQQATMWGPSIIGCGSAHYRYESGREGDICRIGFAPRAKELALYVGAGAHEAAPFLARLGKHRTGKGCLYLKRLADVDLIVLESLLTDSLARSRATYPETGTA